jgi:hypothetical protein
MDYRWFAIAAKGALLPISCDQESYDAICSCDFRMISAAAGT